MFKIPVSTVFLGKNLLYLPECASTNSFASELTSRDNVQEGTVIITTRQFLGRGQRGNAWESEEGANLTLSIILYPTFLVPSTQFMLSKAISLGVVDTLRRLGVPDAEIKWPNDVMIVDRKVCGILIESQVRGSELSQSIVGVGLNVNQVAFKQPRATSVAMVTGRRHDLNEVLAVLLACIEVRYHQLRDTPGILSTDYLELLYWRNQAHLFESAGKGFKGIIEDVDEFGRLCVSAAGEISKYDVKEIAYVK